MMSSRGFLRTLFLLFWDSSYDTGEKDRETYCRKGSLTIGLAESCTGGLVAGRITDVPGSSAYFMAGLVTYSNKAKTKFLSVPDEIIARHGAVSNDSRRAYGKRGTRSRGG